MSDAYKIVVSMPNIQNSIRDESEKLARSRTSRIDLPFVPVAREAPKRIVDYQNVHQGSRKYSA